jgi:hypothetical protein
VEDPNTPASEAVIIGSGAGEVDICAAVVSDYLAGLPVDPLTNNGAPVTDCAVAHTTGYSIVRSGTNNRITVFAPAAELGQVISVTR